MSAAKPVKGPSEWRSLQALVDLTLVALTWFLAFWLRFNLEIPPEFTALLLQTLPWPLASFALGLLAFGVYRHIWRYTSTAELLRLVYGVILSGLLTAASVLMVRYANFPRSVLVLHPLLALLALGAVRAGWRVVLERRSLPERPGKPLVVIGAVQEAADALRALKGSLAWAPRAIVSPRADEVGRTLQGVPVMGSLAALPAVAERVGARLALVAAPPGSPERREALMRASDAGIALLTLPRADEWLRAESTGPRKVELEDLLGRAPVQLDVRGLSDLFAGQTVLVTGAGGSIGSELCRQVARFGVARLVCVDVSEFAIYQLEQELRTAHPQVQVRYYTANVREYERLRALALAERPAVVFHAAAYKHVPLMEEGNEIEALRTNVLGTLNVARVAGECGAGHFVLVSTDKAVNPTNVMGASKRLAERVLQSVAIEFPGTHCLAVRFGNVLGSSGSVVPLFAAQIARGGPVTVTHPDIVRYFMTIPEAAQLVLQAGLMGRSGQIFVLDMGEAVKIVELARIMIRLSGQTEQEVPIAFTGLRPGEKLFEELLADGETTEPTPHAKLRVARTGVEPPLDLLSLAAQIDALGPLGGAQAVRSWLRDQVPEYRPRSSAQA